MFLDAAVLKTQVVFPTLDRRWLCGVSLLGEDGIREAIVDGRENARRPRLPVLGGARAGDAVRLLRGVAWPRRR